MRKEGYGTCLVCLSLILLLFYYSFSKSVHMQIDIPLNGIVTIFRHVYIISAPYSKKSIFAGRGGCSVHSSYILLIYCTSRMCTGIMRFLAPICHVYYI